MATPQQTAAQDAIFLVRNLARVFGEPGAEALLARLAARAQTHPFPVFEADSALAADRRRAGVNG